MLRTWIFRSRQFGWQYPVLQPVINQDNPPIYTSLNWNMRRRIKRSFPTVSNLAKFYKQIFKLSERLFYLTMNFSQEKFLTLELSHPSLTYPALTVETRKFLKVFNIKISKVCSSYIIFAIRAEIMNENSIAGGDTGRK